MNLLFVFGTRPEAIKMAPIISYVRNSTTINAKVCVTGQHDTMLQQVLSLFNIKPDFNLGIMKPNQTLTGIVSNVLLGMSDVFSETQPDYVLVQGDTTSAFAAALAAFNHHLFVAHIEAGLRSGDRLSPWPEEMNRRLVAPLADLHFAPTQVSFQNLVNSGVSPSQIEISGNTVIDALLDISKRLNTDTHLFNAQTRAFPFIDDSKKLIVVTGHRRESFGEGFEAICHALKKIAARSDVQIIYPVHLNPNVQEPVHRILHDCNNVHLIAPTDYLSFVYLLNQSYFILTDSGGIQEEAPSLGKPVLVMRNNTERPEAVDAGTSRLVGTDTDNIVNAANELLDDKKMYAAMSHKKNPYGDGHASEIIVRRLMQEHAFYSAANLEYFHHDQRKSA